MKKMLFGFIATVMITSLSFGQTSAKEYFDKPIFKLLEKSNTDLYNELISSKFEIQNINEKKVVFFNLKNGYFLDNSEKMIYAEINKNNKTISVNDFTSNTVITLPLTVNDKNIFDSVDEKHSTESFNIFDQETSSSSNVTFSKPCADNVGFAMCYTLAMVASAAIAASDGPLPFMDAAAITYLVGQTAYCHRSHCGW